MDTLAAAAVKDEPHIDPVAVDEAAMRRDAGTDSDTDSDTEPDNSAGGVGRTVSLALQALPAVCAAVHTGLGLNTPLHAHPTTVARMVEDALHQLARVDLQVAVVGSSGGGKSFLVNHVLSGTGVLPAAACPAVGALLLPLDVSTRVPVVVELPENLHAAPPTLTVAANTADGRSVMLFEQPFTPDAVAAATDVLRGVQTGHAAGAARDATLLVVQAPLPGLLAFSDCVTVAACGSTLQLPVRVAVRFVDCGPSTVPVSDAQQAILACSDVVLQLNPEARWFPKPDVFTPVLCAVGPHLTPSTCPLLLAVTNVEKAFPGDRAGAFTPDAAERHAQLLHAPANVAALVAALSTSYGGAWALASHSQREDLVVRALARSRFVPFETAPAARFARAVGRLIGQHVAQVRLPLVLRGAAPAVVRLADHACALRAAAAADCKPLDLTAIAQVNVQGTIQRATRLALAKLGGLKDLPAGGVLTAEGVPVALADNWRSTVAATDVTVDRGVARLHQRFAVLEAPAQCMQDAIERHVWACRDAVISTVCDCMVDVAGGVFRLNGFSLDRLRRVCLAIVECVLAGCAVPSVSVGRRGYAMDSSVYSATAPYAAARTMDSVQKEVLDQIVAVHAPGGVLSPRMASLLAHAQQLRADAVQDMLRVVEVAFPVLALHTLVGRRPFAAVWSDSIANAATQMRAFMRVAAAAAGAPEPGSCPLRVAAPVCVVSGAPEISASDDTTSALYASLLDCEWRTDEAGETSTPTSQVHLVRVEHTARMVYLVASAATRAFITTCMLQRTHATHGSAACRTDDGAGDALSRGGKWLHPVFVVPELPTRRGAVKRDRDSRDERDSSMGPHELDPAPDAWLAMFDVLAEPQHLDRGAVVVYPVFAGAVPAVTEAWQRWMLVSGSRSTVLSAVVVFLVYDAHRGYDWVIDLCGLAAHGLGAAGYHLITAPVARCIAATSVPGAWQHVSLFDGLCALQEAGVRALSDNVRRLSKEQRELLGDRVMEQLQVRGVAVSAPLRLSRFLSRELEQCVVDPGTALQQAQRAGLVNTGHTVDATWSYIVQAVRTLLPQVAGPTPVACFCKPCGSMAEVGVLRALPIACVPRTRVPASGVVWKHTASRCTRLCALQEAVAVTAAELRDLECSMPPAVRVAAEHHRMKVLQAIPRVDTVARSYWHVVSAALISTVSRCVAADAWATTGHLEAYQVALYTDQVVVVARAARQDGTVAPVQDHQAAAGATVLGTE